MKSFIIAVLFALPALSQQLSISGTVTNSKTGEPIARAMVSLNGFIAPAPEASEISPARPIRRSAFTDAGGKFQFSGLSEGQYVISASKPQFTSPPRLDATAVGTIKLSTSRSDVTVKLSPLGVITGTVTDQDGLPLPGISVQILSSVLEEGVRQIKSDRTVTTDDRGIYRTWNLTPGRYFVKAAFAGGSLEYVGNALPISGDESFTPIYFGGSKIYDSAAAIDLEPGAESRADFKLNFEPAWRVTGTLKGFTSRSPIQFELVNSEGDASLVRASVNGDVGKFAVGPFVPGAYRLRATQGTSVAEAGFTVQAQDLTGVTMSLLPNADVRVITRFSNDPIKAGPQYEGAVLGEFRPDDVCFTKLVPRSPSQSLIGHSSKQQEDKSLSIIESVPPGKYFVEFLCPAGVGYIRSAISGNQDLATDPVLTILPGSIPSPIEITAAWGGGTITGSVKSTKAASVLLVPQFPDPEGPRLFSSFPDPEHPDESYFGFSGLGTGSYSIWALEESDIEFRSPQFLHSLTSGTPVRIEGEENKIITIDSVVRK